MHRCIEEVAFAHNFEVVLHFALHLLIQNHRIEKTTFRWQSLFTATSYMRRETFRPILRRGDTV
jgi:hypothetical protein